MPPQGVVVEHAQAPGDAVALQDVGAGDPAQLAPARRRTGRPRSPSPACRRAPPAAAPARPAGAGRSPAAAPARMRVAVPVQLDLDQRGLVAGRPAGRVPPPARSSAARPSRCHGRGVWGRAPVRGALHRRRPGAGRPARSARPGPRCRTSAWSARRSTARWRRAGGPGRSLRAGRGRCTRPRGSASRSTGRDGGGEGQQGPRRPGRRALQGLGCPRRQDEHGGAHRSHPVVAAPGRARTRLPPARLPPAWCTRSVPEPRARSRARRRCRPAGAGSPDVGRLDGVEPDSRAVPRGQPAAPAAGRDAAPAARGQPPAWRRPGSDSPTGSTGGGQCPAGALAPAPSG